MCQIVLIYLFQRYLKNIPGTTAYWQQNSNNVDAIIDTLGPPQIYFTFTYADQHDKGLHEFLEIPTDASQTVIKHYLNNNPHLVNWFFTMKFGEYYKEYLEKICNGSPEKGGWIWYRFEWQFRKIIHCHGLMKMGGAPDTHALSQICAKGYESSLTSEPKSAENKLAIENGLNAEKELIRFFDEHVSADTDIKFEDWVLTRPKGKDPTFPLNKKRQDIPEWINAPIKINLLEKDTRDLAMILQFHDCNNGTCKKVINGEFTKCKYKMPKPLSSETRITYERLKFKDGSFGSWEANIIAKRVNNDKIFNYHLNNLEQMRSNGDWSIIHNLRKTKQYVAKYASKAEKKSNAFKTAYTDVVTNCNNDDLPTATIIKKIINKVSGER